MKNTLKRILIPLAVLAFLFTIVTPVFASGGVTGDVTANNVAPTITSVTLLPLQGGDAVTAMVPQEGFALYIVAADANTVDDIKQVDVSFFYSADGSQVGTPGLTFDADQNAVFKWVNNGDGTGTWSMALGNTQVTTWELVEGSSTPVDMEATEFAWMLYFVPGKLAMEALATGDTSPEWDIKVTVTDVAGLTDTKTITKIAMAAYSGIAMSKASMTFGSLALGTSKVIQDDGNKITTSVIANSAYALGVSSAANWTQPVTLKTIALDNSGTPGSTGEFGLIIDDATTGGGTPTSLLQPVTSADAPPITITGHGSDARTATEAGASEGISNQDLYMRIGLSGSGIYPGLYTGTITFSVTSN